jgi:hypothetical protein
MQTTNPSRDFTAIHTICIMWIIDIVQIAWITKAVHKTSQSVELVLNVHN